MTWLERHAPHKYDPTLTVPGTQSLLIAGMDYFQPRQTLAVGAGQVARYAWGRDYHKVFLEKLKAVSAALGQRWPGSTFRAFTDTSPLDERYWAEQAGACFTARNTLSIRHDVGSWFLLGEIFSPVDFAPTQGNPPQGACPSACRRCVDVCPTQALDGEGRMDARRCISYLTIEHRGPIPLELRSSLGSWLFGCDLCQEVCPFNLKASVTSEPQFLAWKAGSSLDVLEILELVDETAFTIRFGGSPVHRAGFQGLRRNACIVAGNLRLSRAKPVESGAGTLQRLSQGSDEVVAEAALWALAQGATL
jgi:epoxyqueuosine reductase